MNLAEQYRQPPADPRPAAGGRGRMSAQVGARSARGRVVRLPYAAHGLLAGRAPPVTAMVGALAAAGVGYLVARNPQAQPAGMAVAARVGLIALVTGAAVHAQSHQAQARFGRAAAAAAVACAVWLLNGSALPLPFSAGMLAGGLIPVVLCGLLLTYPTGRLRSRTDRVFLAASGGAIGLGCTALVLMGRAPPLTTPLTGCAPNCPRDVLALGSGAWPIAPALRALVVGGLLVLTWGTAALAAHHARSAPASHHRTVTPLVLTALLYAVAVSVAVSIWGLGTAIDPRLTLSVGSASLMGAVLVPVGIMSALALERHDIGRALADLVTGIAARPRVDPLILLAQELHDPSLEIAYRSPGCPTCVTRGGETVDPADPGNGRAVAWIERDRQRVAAVIYDSELAGQERFIRAAGAAALLELERTALVNDLQTSLQSLASSRIRLVEAADAERRRIERDLHDGIQQDLLGLRMRLDVATQALREDPARGDQLLALVGVQLDDTLETMRTLASGIYPALLDRCGVAEAVKSVARRAPVLVTVDDETAGRCCRDVEVAVYFCCLEALQNVAKHAGDNATAHVRLWQRGDELRFTVRDTGRGFDRQRLSARHGLFNMRDRIAAVDGTLSVTSKPDLGTLVRGSVPREGPKAA